MKAKKQTYKDYMKKVDKKNPKHILGVIILIILVGIIAMWLIKVLIYLAIILGIAYLFYLLIQRKKQVKK